MSEIENMYKNAGIKEYCSVYDTTKYCEGMVDCSECADMRYPEFTAEKQLELIKWFTAHWCYFTLGRLRGLPTFEESLAHLINYVWQALSEEEKQEVKEILE